MTPRFARFATTSACVLAIAIAVLAVLPLLRGDGVPMVLHDWSWPAARSQIASFAFSGMRAWHPEGLGDPMTYPSPWLPYLVVGSLCAMLGVHAGLATAVFALVVLAFFSAYRFARTFLIAPVWCAVAALSYEASPMVFNELHAGHWIELASYALLPYALARMRTVARPSMIVDGVVLGIASVQLQYLAFGIVALAICGTRRPLRATLGTIAIAALFFLPQVAVGIVDPHDLSLDVFRPYAEWTVSQGASPACALRSLCYIGGYDTSLPGWLPSALYAPPLYAVVGLLQRARGASVRACALILLGTILAAGAKSPLAPLWLAFYQHVPLAAVFRENYHFSVFTQLGTMLGIACGLARIGALPPFSATPFAAATAVIATFVGAFATADIPAYDLSAQVARVERATTRFMILPAIAPWSYGGGTSQGFVPLTLAANGAIPANGVILKAPVAAANAALAACRPQIARELLERAGIGLVRPIPDLRSTSQEALPPFVRAPDRPVAVGACALGTLHPRPRLDATPGVVRLGTTLDDGAASIDPVTTDIDLLALSRSPDPRATWARTALWPTLPAWVFLEPEGLFTLRPRAVLETDGPADVVAGSERGLAADGCTTVARLDAHFTLFRCGRDPVFRGIPPLVAARAFATTARPLRTERYPAADVRLASSSPSTLDGTVANAAPALIVLREQFDALWTIDVPARHVRIDGFYNGWIVEPGPRRHVRIRFGGEAPLAASLVVSIALLVCAIAFAVRDIAMRYATAKIRFPIR